MARNGLETAFEKLLISEREEAVELINNIMISGVWDGNNDHFTKIVIAGELDLSGCNEWYVGISVKKIIDNNSSCVVVEVFDSRGNVRRFQSTYASKRKTEEIYRHAWYIVEGMKSLPSNYLLNSIMKACGLDLNPTEFRPHD